MMKTLRLDEIKIAQSPSELALLGYDK